uniref:A to I editase domain-containing protein n=1 Tax=Tetranychus urticae TaxID=32264 RepID=T1JSK6_TETUR
MFSHLLSSQVNMIQIGDRLSMTGTTIHDSHAEILSRRCFIAFLYQQIQVIIDNNYQDRAEFILKVRDDGYGFCLKPGIKINLFISTAPCGDARVFMPNDSSDDDPHANRVSRGLLRAKIEAGEGTIPVRRGCSTLTWDGVLLGEQRLQFMSCSDKIAVWNVVGIQGSLLSHFIEPIYLDSLILGSLFNFSHLTRAVHGRLNMNFDSESLKKLPNPYKVNQHKVAKSLSKQQEYTRTLTKSPNYAINWIKGDTFPEIISCDTGKIYQNEEQYSRLSKKTFFQSFRTLLGRNTPKLCTSPLGLAIPTIYRDAKTSATNYLQARLLAVQSFAEQNLGDWIQVPAEVDLFGF